jgi:hypothetical protein
MFIPGEDELLGIIAENLGANLVAIEEADHPRREPIELNHTPMEDGASPGGQRISVRVSGGELVPGGMRLLFRIGDGDFKELPMQPGGEGYEATIPSVSEGDKVEYYFVAQTTDQGMAFLPAYGPYEVFSYTVGSPRSSTSAAGLVPVLIILLVVVVAYVTRKLWMPTARRLVTKYTPIEM